MEDPAALAKRLVELQRLLPDQDVSELVVSNVRFARASTLATLEHVRFDDLTIAVIHNLGHLVKKVLISDR
jgi:hypothetical protein